MGEYVIEPPPLELWWGFFLLFTVSYFQNSDNLKHVFDGEHKEKNFCSSFRRIKQDLLLQAGGRGGQQEKELVPRKLCSGWVGFLLCFDFLLL